MSDDNKLEAFKNDLKVLLKRYDATLGVHMKGDTYGIYENYVTVSFRETPDKACGIVWWTEAVSIEDIFEELKDERNN